MDKLEKEIKGLESKELSFTCDQCEQMYYEDEDVEKKEVYFGAPPSPRPVIAEETAPKKEKNRLGYQRDGGSRPQDMVILGRPADEATAILRAIEAHSRFTLRTGRSVYQPQMDMKEPTLDEGHFDDQVDSNRVGITLKAEPRQSKSSPDAIICEYCKEGMSNKSSDPL